MMLAPLILSWVAAPVFLLLNGKRRLVSSAAVLVLGLVFALDIALLVRTSGGAVLEQVSGNWPQGVGIRLRVDAGSALYATIAALVLSLVLAHETLSRVRTRAFPALVLFLCVGLHGLFFTGDAFNFYVFFELSMVSAFALASYGHGGAELRATWVFVVVNLLGSVTLLAAVTSLYHLAGTLDLEILRTRAVHDGGMPLLMPAALFLAAFSLKLGLFPFHYWVPPVYRDTRPAVAAVFTGALALVGTYGLLRLGLGVFRLELAGARSMMVALGAASALYGSVLALNRRVAAETLAYTSIAHAGLLLVAIGLGGRHGALAACWLAMSGALDKSLLFLALPLSARPGRAAALVGAMSASGVPVTLGFLGKLELLRATVESDVTSAALVIVVTGALTIGGLFRLTAGPKRAEGEEVEPGGLVWLPAGLLLLIVVVLGAAPGLVSDAVLAAAVALGGER